MPAVVSGLVLVTALALLAVLAACGGDDAEPEATDDGVYFALGDSISAGGGAPPYATECFRSELGWPYVVAEADAAVGEPDLRACGGAAVDHLLDAWPDRNQVAQIGSVPNRTVELVTFTIGANDVHFSQIVLSCLYADCSALFQNPDFVSNLAALRGELIDEVYPRLRQVYPNARIVHVGYPRLTPPIEVTPVGCDWFTPEEAAVMVELMATLSSTAEEAAAAVPELDIDYVDVTDTLAGHEMCTPDPWMNPATAGSDMFHPTAEGYDAIGSAVAAALDG